MAYSVYLKKGEERRLLAGHSWVYANEAAKMEGDGGNGSLASVYAHDGRFIGKGYINHLSKILVRIFLRGEGEDDDAFYCKKIAEANALRERLVGGDNYRMVFGEADGLPALIADRYGDCIVLECLSLGVDKRKERIAGCFAKLFSPRCVYMRGTAPVRRKEGLPLEDKLLYGELPEELTVTENGLTLGVDIQNGQKTGFFLDQKENRLALRRYAAGGRVLDCFCNSGGFSLNAALVAKEVVANDISESALEVLRQNAARNGLTNIRTVQGDAFDLLRKLRADGEQFDCVVLDPPAFCKSAAEVPGAYRGYRDINVSAMKLVKRGGFLLTCSCSHYMTPPLFEKMLRESAQHAGREARLLEARGQAPDHPTLLAAEETGYLKAYYLQVN